MPSDAALENALRDTVRKIYDGGDLEELTVKRVRATVEHELRLASGFFKQGEWKNQSKSIIEREALKRGNIDAESTTKPSSQAAAKFSEHNANTSASKERNVRRKRNASDDIKDANEHRGDQLAKKQRKSRSVVSDDEDEEEEGEHQTSRQDRSVSESDGVEELSLDKRQPKPNTGSSGSKQSADNAAVSQVGNDLGDSDLSEVLDEAPISKRKKKAPTKKPKSDGKKHAKADKHKAVNAEAEEIKTLQGWLVKCGIRKVWGKELKPYETSKEKIKHLKQMLTDAGMSGRYSKEKAASIREARELAADLEAVQEGAKLWGKDNGADAPVEGRRAARTAMPRLDFSDSDSED